jgi:uncharacterized membrane protein YGL010W
MEEINLKDTTNMATDIKQGQRAAVTEQPATWSTTVLGGRTSEQWIAQYSRSHQHPVNLLCHTFGIPTILVSFAVFVAALFVHRLWVVGLALFVLGWLLQIVGHVFEGKPPEFLRDWRFLFVGVRWWWAKISGRA